MEQPGYAQPAPQATPQNATAKSEASKQLEEYQRILDRMNEIQDSKKTPSQRKMTKQQRQQEYINKFLYAKGEEGAVRQTSDLHKNYQAFGEERGAKLASGVPAKSRSGSAAGMKKDGKKNVHDSHKQGSKSPSGSAKKLSPKDKNFKPGNKQSSPSKDKYQNKDLESLGEFGMNSFARKSAWLNRCIEGDQCIDLSEIQECLNGYGRIIEFQFRPQDAGSVNHKEAETGAVISPELNLQNMHIQRMNEGHFKHGLFNGFGRCIDHTGAAYVGFWKLLQKSAVIGKQKITIEFSGPHGKWVSYDKDGNVFNKEGAYLSNVLTKCSRMTRPLEIESFKDNVEPLETFGMRMTDMFRGCGLCRPMLKHSDPDSLYIYDVAA